MESRTGDRKKLDGIEALIHAPDNVGQFPALSLLTVT